MTDLISDINEAFFYLVEEGTLVEGYSINQVAEQIFRYLGVTLFPMYGDEECEDWLLYSDSEGSYPTWAGAQLIEAEMAYDWETPCHERHPGREPWAGEEVIRYGDSHCEYIGVVQELAQLSSDILEELHLTLFRHLPTLMADWKEDLIGQRKAFGQAINAELKEAGCSDKEINAWWSMRWKNEVHPKQWAKYIEEVDSQTIAIGLACHSGDALERANAFLRSSYPRSLDLLKGLAKAKRIRKISRKEYLQWLKNPVDVTADEVTSTGERRWIF